jgi:hypothetical protein
LSTGKVNISLQRGLCFTRFEGRTGLLGMPSLQKVRKAVYMHVKWHLVSSIAEEKFDRSRITMLLQRIVIFAERCAKCWGMEFSFV